MFVLLTSFVFNNYDVIAFNQNLMNHKTFFAFSAAVAYGYDNTEKVEIMSDLCCR